jgi:hypothetical protein
MRAGTEQRHAELRARVEDMLTVVEHQQHVPIGQVPPYGISRRVPRGAANVEHPRRLSRYVFGRIHRGKIDEPNAIGPLPGLATTQFDGRSGLAHAGRASQRHQPSSAQHVANGLWSSDARPINLVRGAGIEGIDPYGPLCSRGSSSRSTTEFWHQAIAFRSPPNLPMHRAAFAR